MEKTLILNAEQIQLILQRLAYQVYETHLNEKKLFIAGVDDIGFQIAKRISEHLEKISSITIQLEKIKINKDAPWEEPLDISFTNKDYKNSSVLIVDDVLNSGKVLMHSTKLFLNTPIKQIKTLVFVDRNHAKYPIKADFVGYSFSNTIQEHVDVDFAKKNNEKVFLV